MPIALNDVRFHGYVCRLPNGCTDGAGAGAALSGLRVPSAFSCAIRSSIRTMSKVEFEAEPEEIVPSSLERARTRARAMLLNRVLDLPVGLMVFLRLARPVDAFFPQRR